MSGVTHVTMAVKQASDSSPLYPQLLTYRCDAANRRFGPTAEVAATVEPTLSANAQHCASTLTFSQQVVHEIAPASRVRVCSMGNLPS